MLGQNGEPKKRGRLYLAVTAVAVVTAAGAVSLLSRPRPTYARLATEESMEQRGRYLVATAGCNDCHTPGWMQEGAKVGEEAWLTGVPVGWRGPWGTTYASNLRLFVKDMDEDLFVQVVRARNTRPPMPWMNLHAMNESDLRAIYRYVRSLPVTGERMPEYCPPGVEPKTPYFVMEPKMPQGQ